MNSNELLTTANSGVHKQPRGLAFSGVSKSVKVINYSSQHEEGSSYSILSNVSGVIYAGEMMALMGLSGCG
jgi:ABC-type glutathione transport system ATPase component